MSSVRQLKAKSKTPGRHGACAHIDAMARGDGDLTYGGGAVGTSAECDGKKAFITATAQARVRVMYASDDADGAPVPLGTLYLSRPVEM